MRYTWDPEKDALNRRKHDLTLADGIDVLEDPLKDSWIDDRYEYGEVRIITLGLGKKAALYVVTTAPCADLTRIISVKESRG